MGYVKMAMMYVLNIRTIDYGTEKCFYVDEGVYEAGKYFY